MTDGQTDGRTDGRTDGQTDGRWHIARSAHMLWRCKADNTHVSTDSVESIRLMSDKMSSVSGQSSSSSSLVIYAVEGRTCSVTCSVLGGSPPPNIELVVDGGRDLTPSTTLTRRLTVVPRVGLGLGFRRLVFSSERATVDYRPWPVEDGRSLQCIVAVSGLAPRVLSAILDIDCKYSVA